MSERTEAQRLYEKGVKESARRLVQLLDADAPAPIVCNELGAIVSRATVAYGELAHAKIGQHARRAKLIAEGFCVECESRPGGGYVWGTHHCDDCHARLEQDVPGPEVN